jgi:hypothetical protein
MLVEIRVRTTDLEQHYGPCGRLKKIKFGTLLNAVGLIEMAIAM